VAIPFPPNLREFQRRFSTEQACADYLALCRWPDGYQCPRCQSRRAYALVNQGRFQCAKCRYQVSLPAGTILENTKLPLTAWFWAAYSMATDGRGVSALWVRDQLGMGYKSAWLLLHKLRRAAVAPERTKLRGVIEMDETWVGGWQSGVRGSRQLKGRKAALVIVAVERRGRATGRARMEVIPNFRQVTMNDFARRNIELGSTIYTDKMTGFDGFTKAGFVHYPTVQGKIRKGAPHVVPLADRAMGNMKQWLLGTHHGVSNSQLQAYLDEWVFRHNRRHNRQAAFQTLLGLGAARQPAPLSVVRGGSDYPQFAVVP
jgi:transposase-like protein